MNARGTRRPHARTPRPRDVKPSRRGGGGDSGGGGGLGFVKDVACGMQIPVAVGRTVLALAQLAAVEWRIRGAR